MISFKSVNYTYPNANQRALHNIDLTIATGESIAVMGRNGSGKSTFAKLIANLCQPDRGIVKISDANNNSLKVGLIFQNPDNQMVAMTVEKELAFALENLGLDQEMMEQKIKLLLDEFKISHLRHRLTGELSGGEKQKVALASVMISDPDILILDEPDSYLDKSGGKILFQELNRLKSNNQSMIIIHITQYLQTALKYPRLLVFNNAALVADDNPDKIFSNRNFCLENGLAAKNSVSNQNSSVKLKKSEPSIEWIQLRNLYFEYQPEKPLISNLSIEFKKDEIVGLIGNSGCGKSSLSSLLAGLLQPDRGEIGYYDKDGNRWETTKIDGRIAVSFQFPERQFFLNSCREELLFGVENKNLSLTGEQLNSIFDTIGLPSDKFAERDPFSLSGGEQRRLAFGIIKSLNPDFVIFDEPTCGLDIPGVQMFLEFATELNQQGCGIILISHNKNVISQLVDRVLIFNQPSSFSVLKSDDPKFDQVLEQILIN